VANRAATIDRLATEVAQARRYRHPVAVALLDVDGFSLVNRKHGMAAGDAALREVALRIRLRIRAADELGRINGDRFLAILPHTDDAGATTFAEALRRRLAHRPVGAGETAMRLTASVGIAVMQPGEPLDVDGLLARAHDALAAAKGAGGDRIARAATPELERLDDRREPRLHAIDRDDEQDAGEP
jgi:diguanylate cyclase (GGDEF)-like protein